MLGEMIGELKGKVTGNRVLPAECCPKIESSFQDIGKVLGIDVTDMGTFLTIFKEDGGLYGEGQGIFFTGEGIVTWTGQGVGKMKGKAMEWRGSAFFNTSSKKLTRLNSIVGVFEYDIDEEGNTQEKLWEWI